MYKDNRPKINEDMFKYFLIKNDIVDELKISSGSELTDKFIQLNDIYERLVFDNFLKKLKMRDSKYKRKSEIESSRRIFEKIKNSDRYMFIWMFQSSDMIIWLNDLIEYNNCLISFI